MSVQTNFSPIRQDKDRDLTVLDAEADGGGEGVLREEAGTVEIVETVGSVEPTTHIAIVTYRVAHYPTELLAGVAALRGGIRDDNAL